MRALSQPRSLAAALPRRRAPSQAHSLAGAFHCRRQAYLKNAVKAELATPTKSGIPVVAVKNAHSKKSENGHKRNKTVTLTNKLKNENTVTKALSIANIL